MVFVKNTQKFSSGKFPYLYSPSTWLRDKKNCNYSHSRIANFTVFGAVSTQKQQCKQLQFTNATMYTDIFQ